MDEKKYEHPAQEIDELQFRLSCAVGVVGAIHTAMEEEDGVASDYIDALYGAFDYLHNLSKELRKCIDALSDEKKTERGAAVA